MMKCFQYLTFVLLFFLLCSEASSQEKADSTVYSLADAKPVLIDGFECLYEDIASNLKYPSTQMTVVGRVYLGFIVEKDGSVTNIEIVKSLHPKFDKEAVRTLKEIFKVTKYTPGTHEGVPVRVRMILPIYFKLGN